MTILVERIGHHLTKELRKSQLCGVLEELTLSIGNTVTYLNEIEMPKVYKILPTTKVHYKIKIINSLIFMEPTKIGIFRAKFNRFRKVMSGLLMDQPAGEETHNFLKLQREARS